MATENDNIIELLGPGEVIGRAIEVIMTRHDVDRDTAFAMLVQNAVDARDNVRQVAARIIVQRGGEDS